MVISIARNPRYLTHFSILYIVHYHHFEDQIIVCILLWVYILGKTVLPYYQKILISILISVLPLYGEFSMKDGRYFHRAGAFSS